MGIKKEDPPYEDEENCDRPGRRPDPRPDRLRRTDPDQCRAADLQSAGCRFDSYH